MRHFSGRCHSMRNYQRVLLVVILASVMIAAGVGWERFCVAPLVEQALRRPEPSDSDMDDLPAACLEELSAMGPAGTTTDLRTERASAPVRAAPSGPSPALDENVLRPGGGSNQLTTRIQVTDGESAAAMPTRCGTLDPARPVGGLGRGPTSGRFARRATRERTGASPASVEEATRPSDLGDSLKSVDVLDLMRRLRGGCRPAGRGAAGAGAEGVQRGRFGTCPAAFQSRHGKPQAACAGSAAIIERGCCKMADVACAGSAAGSAVGCRFDPGNDRRSGLIGSRGGPGPQRPRSADPGIGRPDRQAARFVFLARRLDRAGRRGEFHAVIYCPRPQLTLSAKRYRGD